MPQLLDGYEHHEHFKANLSLIACVHLHCSDSLVQPAVPGNSSQSVERNQVLVIVLFTNHPREYT